MWPFRRRDGKQEKFEERDEFYEDKEIEQEELDRKGTLTSRGKHDEQRNLVKKQASHSDWLVRVRELRRLELMRFAREAVVPTHGYLLYHDGKFQGFYSSTRLLDSTAVLFNEYRVYEYNNQRKLMVVKFKDVPMLDDANRTTDVTIEMQRDIIRPELLVEKAVLDIRRAVRAQIEGVVRQVNSRFRVSQQGECEAELRAQLETQQYDFGIEVRSIAVRRDVPQWAKEQIEKEIKDRDDRTRRKIQREEEEEERRIRTVREDEEEKRAVNRELSSLRLTQVKQEMFLELLKKHDVEGLMTLAAAEKDGETRFRLEKLIGDVQGRQDQTYQRQLEADTRRRDEDKDDFERRVRIAEMMHGQQMDKLERLNEAGLTRPEFLLNDVGSRQAVNDIVGGITSNPTADTFGIKVTNPNAGPANVRKNLPPIEERPRLGQGERPMDDDEDDQSEVIDNKSGKPSLNDAED